MNKVKILKGRLLSILVHIISSTSSFSWLHNLVENGTGLLHLQELLMFLSK